MTDPPLRVFIVGGGIAGCVAALALRQRGHEVVLAEQRSDIAGVGHGITVQGNALKAFDSVGVFARIAERGFPFGHLRMRSADGQVIAEIPTPPMGGPDLPPTMGALRSDIADVLAEEVVTAGIDVRLGVAVTDLDDQGDRVVVLNAAAATETADLVIGADGIRSHVRRLIGIDVDPTPVGMGIWRVVAKRPEEMTCSELYYGGPKYKAGYTPISQDECYAFLIEGNLDRSFVGEFANGKVLKEHGTGYGGIWGQVRDSIADDQVVNYQWIEAVKLDVPWHVGRVVLIGDAAHACPPLIAQGAAMAVEDAVVLAEVLDSADSIEEAFEAFMARRGPRAGMVLDNSLLLAEWEMHPETPGADPGRIMGQTLHALCEPA